MVPRNVAIINSVMGAADDKVYKSYFSNLIIFLNFIFKLQPKNRVAHQVIDHKQQRLRACIRASGQCFEQLLNN